MTAVRPGHRSPCATVVGLCGMRVLSGLVDVSFFNEHDGFAVGSLGDGTTAAEQNAARTVILATSDGGATWRVRYMSAAPGQRAWRIQFANDRIGYVTTEGPRAEGVVLETTDGGATWRPLAVSTGTLEDRSTLRAVPPSIVFSTDLPLPRAIRSASCFTAKFAIAFAGMPFIISYSKFVPFLERSRLNFSIESFLAVKAL